MKSILFAIFMFLTVGFAVAQDLFENKNNIFHNENGKVISAVTAKDMLYNSTQKYELRRS